MSKDNVGFPPGKSHKCGICDMTFPTEEEHKKHRDNRECKIFNLYKKDTKADKPPVHRIMTLPKKNFKCGRCFLNFPSGLELAKHERSHEWPCPSPTCTMTFLTSKSRHIHVTNLHKDIPFDDLHLSPGFHCPQCPQSIFSTKEALEGHNVVAHLNRPVLDGLMDVGLIPKEPGKTPGATRVFKCSVCSQPFNTLKGQLSHEERHGPGFPCLYALCDVSFTMAHSLKLHERYAHAGQTPDPAKMPKLIFPCSSCLAKFATQDELQAHSIFHEVLKNVVKSQNPAHITAYTTPIDLEEPDFSNIRTSSLPSDKEVEEVNTLKKKLKQEKMDKEEEEIRVRTVKNRPENSEIPAKRRKIVVKSAKKTDSEEVEVEVEIVQDTVKTGVSHGAKNAENSRRAKSPEIEIIKERPKKRPKIVLVTHHVKANSTSANSASSLGDSRTYSCKEKNCSAVFLYPKALNKHVAAAHFHRCSTCGLGFESSMLARAHSLTHFARKILDSEGKRDQNNQNNRNSEEFDQSSDEEEDTKPVIVDELDIPSSDTEQNMEEEEDPWIMPAEDPLGNTDEPEPESQGPPSPLIPVEPNIKIVKTFRVPPKAVNRPSPVAIFDKNTNSYQCIKCSHTHFSISEMLQHVEVHKKEELTCQECLTFFADKESLEKHRLSRHPKHPITNIRNSTNTNYNNAVGGNSAQGDKPELNYRCIACPRTFATKTLQTAHEVSAHKLFSKAERKGSGPTLYYCARCRAGFDTVSARNIHEPGCAGPRVTSFTISKPSPAEKPLEGRGVGSSKRKQSFKPLDLGDVDVDPLSNQPSRSPSIIDLEEESEIVEKVEPEDVFILPDNQGFNWDQFENENV